MTFDAFVAKARKAAFNAVQENGLALTGNPAIASTELFAELFLAFDPPAEFIRSIHIRHRCFAAEHRLTMNGNN